MSAIAHTIIFIFTHLRLVYYAVRGCQAGQLAYVCA
jgi:hypothetical protein